jgi:TonB family protein
MAEGGKGLAITALVLGIVGLFTIGGLGVGSLVGLALAGAALTGSSRAGRDVAWAALAANLMALLTLFPVGAAVLAFRASPLAFRSDDSLPVPATPTSIEQAIPDAPPPPPPPPPPARTSSSRTQPGPAAKRPPVGRSEAPPSAPIRVSEQPRKTRHVNPVYPRDALAARVQGVVILECTVSPRGKVVHVETLRSVPMLDAAAIEAVKQWEYTPTLLNGVPVPVILTVTVNFKLS